MTAAASDDRLIRYSSSCVTAVEVFGFLAKKSSFSSEGSDDAWSPGAVSCMAVSRLLVTIMPANRQVISIPVFVSTNNKIMINLKKNSWFHLKNCITK